MRVCLVLKLRVVAGGAKGIDQIKPDIRMLRVPQHLAQTHCR